MSGLILAGIGKGIADAGSTYGNMMFKAAESELADQRAMQRAEALERLKESMLEERAQKDAAKAIEVESRATKIGEERAAKQLTTDVGKLSGIAQRVEGDSPAATDEDFRKLIEENPQYRDVYRKAGLIERGMTRNEERMQAAEDSVQAARELGASSTLLKSYQDTKKSVLDAIKEENRVEADRRRDDRAAADRAAADRRFEALMPIRQQNADANTTRANRPPSGGTDPSKPATTADLQRQITAAQNSLATELGVGKNDVNAEVASLRKKAANGNAKAKATLDGIQPYLDEYNDANKRMLEFKRASPSNNKPGDNSNVNSGSRPPLSSFQR